MILEEYEKQNEEINEGEQLINGADEASDVTEGNADEVSDEFPEAFDESSDDDLSVELEALADDLQEQMTQSEEEQPEEEQPEEEQSEEEQPEEEQSDEEQPEEEQPEEEQPEEEQPEEEQPEEEQPEEEQPEDEQPDEEPAEQEQPEEEPAEQEQPEEEPAEQEQPEEEQPDEEQPDEEPAEQGQSEEQILADRITDLVDGLQEAFSDNSEAAEEEISAEELWHIADELAENDSLSISEPAEDDTMEFEPSDNGGEIELNALASAMSAQNLEAKSFIDDDEDDDVKVFVKKSETEKPSVEEDDDVKVFVTGGDCEPSGAESDDDGVDISAQEQDIGHTNVFQPVRPEPTYGEAGSYSSYYGDDDASALRRKKRYSFFRGVKQIAGLLVIVAGIAWLLSFVAFSVMGENDTVSAEEYDYSTTSTIIKPFNDDQEPEPIIVPEFTAEKLTEGDTGDMVDAVQKTLASLGYLSQSNVSGTYDKATRTAVMQFQKANFLEVTGEVDKTTYSLIFDSNATAPTTRTTDLPTTTETETSATEAQTSASESETQTTPSGQEQTTAPASQEETKPTAATSAESSMEESTTASSSKKTGKDTAENTKNTTAAESEQASSDAAASSENTTEVDSKTEVPVG